MKKIITLLLLSGGLFAAPVVAQEEEDVTYLIHNAGFDEDLTFQADGSMKPAIVTDHSLSDRSWAYITEDSTVYAKPKETSSQKRSDGRKLEATNGFIGRIQGWTVETNQDFPKCEWVYFGSVPYDLQNQAIPIADDGSTYLEVPARPEVASGEDNVGFAYLRAGWGGRAVYKQVVNLPCAVYRLDYYAININPSASKGKNLSRIVCRKDEWKDETGFNDQEWTLHSIEFTPTSEFTMEFGFESEGGSGSNPFLCIDGIKLYKIGEADEFEVLQSEAYDYYDEANALAADSLAEFTQVYADVQDSLYVLLNTVDEIVSEGTDVKALDEACAQLKASVAYVKELIAAAKVAQLQLAYVERVINASLGLPGDNDLNAFFMEHDIESITAADLTDFATLVAAAMEAYWLSQEPSREEPANYAYLIQNSWFCDNLLAPVTNSADDVADAGLTDAQLDATGWTDGSNASNRQTFTYWAADRTAYQLWANSAFTGTLDVHQELTGIPNGIYSLEADLVCNESAVGDQHIYISSSLQDAEGYMTEAGSVLGWTSGAMPAEVEWETVKTAGTVIVVDGKLTIGAASTSRWRDPETGEYNDEMPDISSGQRRGSFWMTNFVLRYHGEATADEIADAKQARWMKANTMMDAMHFAADKAAVADSIAKYSRGEDLDVLNAGIALAKKSEDKYVEIMGEGKTIPTIADEIETSGEDAFGAAHDIVLHAYRKTLSWMDGETATYAQVDSTLNVLKGYSNTYATAYNEAYDVLNELSSVKAKEVINAKMADQKTLLLVDVLLSTEEVDKLVADLKDALAVAEAQDTYEKNKDATDYTAYIKNADSADTAGWNVIDKGDGPIKEGQYLDDGAHKYFDSYKSGGNLLFTMEQRINNLPNGTYTVTALVRTPTEGFCLFTANGGAEKTDTTYTEVPLNYYTVTDSLGHDSLVVASDSHGPIWAAIDAKEKAEGYTALDTEELAIWNANSGKGRGWKKVEISGVNVDNHMLVIGFTTNSQRTGKECKAAWVSATDFTLTLTEQGDNTGWDGPITGISAVPNEKRANAIDGIYTLSGARVAAPQRGLYIIVQDGKSRKVIIR